MKGIKIVFVCLLVLLAGVVSVNAKTVTVDEIVEKAKELSPDKEISYNISGGNIVVTSPYLGASLSAKYNDGVLTYSSSESSETDMLILKYILSSVSALYGFDLDGDDIVDELSKYSYDKCGFSGKYVDDHFTELKVNINKFNINCTNKTSSSTSNTTTKTTVDNPKTGVFVPVAGLSILIVASVVCLIWISKKSFRL